jgi:hypothetical protein
MLLLGFAQKVRISMLYYVLHSDFNVTLSEAKGLTSYDRFFATLRMTFWAKPFVTAEPLHKTPGLWLIPTFKQSIS